MSCGSRHATKQLYLGCYVCIVRYKHWLELWLEIDAQQQDTAAAAARDARQVQAQAALANCCAAAYRCGALPDRCRRSSWQPWRRRFAAAINAAPDPCPCRGLFHDPQRGLRAQSIHHSQKTHHLHPHDTLSTICLRTVKARGLRGPGHSVHMHVPVPTQPRLVCRPASPSH